MRTVVEPMKARPRPDDQMQRLFSGGWPAFIGADRQASRHLGRVREVFADLEPVLLDGDELVAAGWGVPIRWDGDPAHLPEGYTDSLRPLSAATTGTVAEWAGVGTGGHTTGAARRCAYDRRKPRRRLAGGASPSVSRAAVRTARDRR
ncbi:hypothetical protein ACTMS2_20335 [Micromonospora sp. SD12]|uniref:hypothetical protein n=1 Tax=Micromonospora sp. SD12 TaxID=3452216 RepID=UPI003F8C416A